MEEQYLRGSHMGVSHLVWQFSGISMSGEAINVEFSTHRNVLAAYSDPLRATDHGRAAHSRRFQL